MWLWTRVAGEDWKRSRWRWKFAVVAAVAVVQTLPSFQSRVIQRRDR